MLHPCISFPYINSVVGAMGCSIDATSLFDEVCSGRSTCEYYVVGPDLTALDPCPRGATSYLEIQYECLRGNVVHTILYLTAYLYTRGIAYLYYVLLPKAYYV